ncbi:MAG TPA: GDSL-type esterase/lipase family protein [Actinomycetota bacterium]|nr:GDSL-type esterase/lipase family protein [Actinomycetota bacterium]
MRLALLELCLALLLAACDGGDGSPLPLDRPSVSNEPAEECASTTIGRAMVLRFEVGGSCAAGDGVVLVRCSPEAAPVLRMSSTRGPALFLGGPYAVAVESLPSNVRFASRSGGTEILVADPLPPSPGASASGMPSSPSVSAGSTTSSEAPEPLVYVRSDGVTERWLRLEGKRRGRPAVWAIGDSILDGGSEAVERRLLDWDLTLDAEIGRSSSSAPSIAEEAVQADADAVVVELGTNDSSVPEFRDRLAETLDVLAGVPLVVWQTSRGPAEDATIPAVNAAIREAAASYPNVAIADWEAFVPEEAVQTDGIHPDEDFLHLEADLLVPILSEWRAALTREGATSCVPRVLRETS